MPLNNCRSEARNNSQLEISLRNYGFILCVLDGNFSMNVQRSPAINDCDEGGLMQVSLMHVLAIPFRSTLKRRIISNRDGAHQEKTFKRFLKLRQYVYALVMNVIYYTRAQIKMFPCSVNKPRSTSKVTWQYDVSREQLQKVLNGSTQNSFSSFRFIAVITTLQDI